MTTVQLFTREGKPFHGRPVMNDRNQTGYYVTKRTCPRCGGAGGADKWKFTGWTCFECGGNREIPCERFVRLYDGDKLAMLNDRKAKADATRAAKAAERAAIEAARVAAERDGIVADHKTDLDRIAAVVDVNGENSGGFLTDLYHQVFTRARPWTEGQRAAVRKSLDKIEAEIARKAKAAYIGSIGERIEMEITYVRKFDITEQWFGAPVRFIWTFRDENGNTVVYIGGYAKAIEGVMDNPIRIAATVKDHKEYRGEPQTIIQRPKAL